MVQYYFRFFRNNVGAVEGTAISGSLDRTSSWSRLILWQSSGWAAMELNAFCSGWIFNEQNAQPRQETFLQSKHSAACGHSSAFEMAKTATVKRMKMLKRINMPFSTKNNSNSFILVLHCLKSFCRVNPSNFAIYDKICQFSVQQNPQIGLFHRTLITICKHYAIYAKPWCR